MTFEIWIDADSLPTALRPIICRAALRLDTHAFFVADRALPDIVRVKADDTHRVRVLEGNREARSKISMVTVRSGENSADNYIAENAPSGSLCITHDIPLAARLLEKGCTVIDDRGSAYTEENIKALLVNREVNTELRSWGIFSQQQKKRDSGTVKAFADSLDRTITAMLKNPGIKGPVLEGSEAEGAVK